MSGVERFYMAEWSEDAGFGAMDHFVYARDFDAAQSELAALREELEEYRRRVTNVNSQLAAANFELSETRDAYLNQTCRLADSERRNAVTHDLLMRSKEWMAAADCHVLQVAIDEFSGVIGDSAERLQVTFPALMDDIRAALKHTESGASDQCAHSYANKLGCPECGAEFKSAESGASE
jgi:hypothetical protein